MKRIFKQNPLPGFDKIKNKDEQILWTAKPKFAPFILAGLPSWIVGLMIVIISYYVYHVANERGIEPPPVLLFLFFAVVLPLIPFFGRLLSYSNTLYGFTNKRIMIRTGLVKANFKVINHNRIITAEFDVSIIERLFNVGSIRFFSGKTKDTEDGIENVYDYWHAIEDPHEVFKRIKQLSADAKATTCL
ncbi:MAG: PH domain-containing protein [Tannerella sp.]|jgi:uncharacterized membrane protein YdbT with pleckstrin-like domain|nr:PH domain-containing protein [Tannerella sp.]